jgi:phage tail sheath protein FI
MTATFLHGVETLQSTSGNRKITTAKSGVILLVGTAPNGPVNVPTLCLWEGDDAQWLPANAPEPTGYTIPQALRVIRAQGAGIVIVVNVRDPAWTDATATAKVIGGQSGAGLRSGLALAGDCFSLFGFSPKIIIAPGFSSVASVTQEMLARANRINAVAIVDAPFGTSPAQAVAGRGPNGTINFFTSSRRAILCYPHQKAFDPAANGVTLQPLSQFAAGAMAAKDASKGVGFSASNTELQGVQGQERSLTAQIDDANSEVNLLNSVGIMTVFAGFGTGPRLWGNRNASYGSGNSGLETFINCTRFQDSFDEAIRFFSFPFMDVPISGALVDSILGSIAAFINEKINSKELLGAKCWLDPNKNPPDAIADGWLRFSYSLTPAPPFEHGVFDSILTDEFAVLLKSK